MYKQVLKTPGHSSSLHAVYMFVCVCMYICGCHNLVYLVYAEIFLLLLQEHHLRAQQAVGRLQEQMEHHPPPGLLSSGPRDYGTSATRSVTSTVAAAAVREEIQMDANESYAKAKRIRELLAREEGPSREEALPTSSCDGGSNKDHLAELHREVDGLQIRQWIEITRTEAGDQADTLAREACEEIWRGAGSAAVGGEMEGELNDFGKELDSLLLRMDRCDGDDRGRGREDEQDGDAAVMEHHHHGNARAPVTDAHVGRRAIAAAEPSPPLLPPPAQ